MGGQLPLDRGPERQPLQGVDNVMAAIKDEACWQRDNPPSGDTVISTMWDGFLQVVDRDSAVWTLVGSYAANQTVIVEPWTVGGVPISEVNGLLRTAIQFDSIRHGIRFPATRLGWARQLRGLASDPGRSAAVGQVLEHCHSMTTSGDRMAPFEVMRQLKGDSGFLDAASSVGVGARQTQLKDQGYPFGAARLLRKDGSEDDAATQGYACLLGRPVLSGTIVLTDLLSPDSRLARRLSLASLRPSEIMDPTFVEQRRQLLASSLANLVFTQSDLTDRASMGAVREYCQHHQIRSAFLGTVLNIVGQEHVETVIDNVLWALADRADSEVIVAEFAQVDRRKPYTLSLSPNWGRANYGYFGISRGDRERVNRLFAFTTSRPKVGYVGDGSLTVNGTAQPFRKLIEASATGAPAMPPPNAPQPVLHMLA